MKRFVWTRKLLDFNRFKQQKNSKIIKTVFDGLKAFFLLFYLQRPINHAWFKLEAEIKYFFIHTEFSSPE